MTKLRKLFILPLIFFMTSCGGNKIKQYTVTFVQQNQPDIVISVNEGESINELPLLVEVEGYTSKWEDVDLSNITSDIVVNASYTIKKCILKYDLAEAKNDSYLLIDYIEKEFEYNTNVTLLVPECQGYTFDYWMIGDNKYESSSYVIKSDITFKAKWTINPEHERWWSDNF